MKHSKPLITIVFSKEGRPSSTKYAGFVRRLKKREYFPDAEVLVCAIENLIYVTREDKTADVIDSVSNKSIGDSSLVYFKSWSAYLNESAALAQYLDAKAIPFADSTIQWGGVSKLPMHFQLWKNRVPSPTTAYTMKKENIPAAIKAAGIDYPLIVKDVFGEKGRQNYLCKNEKEVMKVANDNPETRFIIQRFMPNDGDYRIGVYGGVASFVIKRENKSGSHLNNTSAGGMATYIPVEKMQKPLLRLAEKASKATGYQISGVDVIIDKITKKAFILEVNQGSQIVTGAFTEENMKGFNKALSRMVSNRYARKDTAKPLQTIGRRTSVRIPELGIVGAVAKIDTGAYSSSLHAENIEVKLKQNKEVLSFDIVPGNRLQVEDGKVKHIETTHFSVQKVMSSNGAIEERYSIKTKMIINRRVINATLTLSDRNMMGYPILVGRRIVRSRFVVNVELNENNEAIWLY